MSSDYSEPNAGSSSVLEKEQTTAPAHARRAVYWLVPDHNGAPAQTGAIPIYGADQLNTLSFPVMPLYDLKVAAAMIPIGDHGLMSFLQTHKHRFLPRYRRVQRDGKQRRIRLLSAAEIQAIRETILLGPGKDSLLPLS